MRSLFVVLFLALFLILGLPYMGIEYLLSKKNPHASALRQLRAVQWAFRIVLRLAGVKATIIGEENVPTDEPVLYIGNHRSYFDVVLTYSRCPRETGYISKDTMKKVPLLGLYMTRLHCLFLDRENVRQGMKVILTAIDYIKDGISICIFPEGTRNKDRDPESLLPFKEGSFKIATKTGCKIVPMALIGTDDILENHFPWIRSRKVTLIYGKPIDPTLMSKAEQKQLGAHVQEVIHQMIHEQLNP